jgi:hypothetical protein
MFGRLRNTIRILTYREPTFGPDAIIVEEREPSPSRASRTISNFLEWGLFVLVVGVVAGQLGKLVSRIVGHHVSTATVIGVTSGALFLLLHNLIMDFQQKIRQKLNLAARAAPFFGNKLNSTLQVIKGGKGDSDTRQRDSVRRVRSG